MPVLPFKRLAAGRQTATIEGFEYKASASNSNPMIVVELALSTGELVNFWVLITVDSAPLMEFLRAAGEQEVAKAIRKKENPSFELDNLIGRTIEVAIDDRQSIHLFTSAHSIRY